MATERKLEILITQKGGDKVQDVIKKIKIEGVSTKKLMQEIVDDIPQVNSTFEASFKKLRKNMEESNEETKNAVRANNIHIQTVHKLLRMLYGSDEGKEADKLKGSLENLEVKTMKVASAQELMQVIVDKQRKSIEELGKVIPTISKIVPILGEIDKMNKENLSSAATLTASRQKQIDAEIKNLKKIPENLIEINNAYEVKEKIIRQQSEIAKKQALDEIEKLKQNKENNISSILIEQLKADKLLEIDNKLKEDLKKNSDEVKKVRKELLEPVKNSKGFIDIDATKENINMAVNALEKYGDSVLKIYNKIRGEYDYQILIAGDDRDKVVELEKEKEIAHKKYLAQVKKINEEIAKTEEKTNSLRLKQFQAFMESTSKLMEGFKKTMNSIGDYFSTGFTAVTKIYDAEISAWNEEKTHLENKNKDIIQQAKDSKTKLENLEKEKKTAQQANDEEKVKALQEQIDKEKEASKESIDTMNFTEERKKELEEKIRKKQVQKEKLDKLNRKATLIKNIGESTANVAQGVTKALAYGPFLGPVLATIVATAGAIQIGIMAQQLKKFENGGLLRGKRHVQGGMRIEGTNIEVEGGEYVVNRVSTDKNMDLIRYINSQRRELSPTDISAFFAKSSQGFEPPFSRAFESGGQLPVVESPHTVDQEYVIEAIRSIRIQPRVAVTDINRMQDEMVSVDNWVGL